MLEVIGIKGVVHIGQISGGLSSAIRLAQGGRVNKYVSILYRVIFFGKFFFYFLD